VLIRGLLLECEAGAEISILARLTLTAMRRPSFFDTLINVAPPSRRCDHHSSGSLLLLVLLILATMSSAASSLDASFNGTVMPAVSWLRVQKYLGDATCGVSGAALIAEDFIRVGDDGVCFTYDPQQSTTMQLPLSFRLWMTDGGSTLITQNYRKKDCITPNGYFKTTVGTCTANVVDKNQWFRLSWFPSKPEATVEGYVQRYFSNVATGAATCSNSALTIERIVRNSGGCFTQPNTKGQQMQYSCKRILTSHWDRLSTTMVQVQLCSSPASTYVVKDYLPPALCELASKYPVASALFLNAFPQNGSSTMAVAVAADQFSADCTVSYEDAFFLSQMRQLQQKWMIKTASCSLSLLCSVLTVAIILLMKRRNDISNVILCMSVSQIFYDCSFYSPYPSSYTMVTSQPYTTSTYVSQFFSRGFSLIVLLISNIFAVSVVYIVALYKQFDVKSRLPTLVCCSVVLGLVFPLTILLVETNVISADLSTAIIAGKANFSNPIVACIFLLGLLQVIGISANALACLLVIFQACNVSPSTGGASSLFETGRPLLEVGKRLSLYPAVQVITQLSSLWFEYEEISKEISDDSYHDERYVVYAYVCSGIVPLAGTLFFLIFLCYHKGALDTVKAELGPWFGYQSSAAQLSGILEADQRRLDKGGGGELERAAFFDDLRDRGVPEDEWDRLYSDYKHKGADLALLREEHPEATEEDIEAMYEREHATLESVINRARNSRPPGSNDEEEEEEEDEEDGENPHPAAGAAGGGWGGGEYQDGDESRFFEHDGRLRAFTKAEMSQMDDEVLVELAIAEQRFRARTRGNSVNQTSSDQVPPPPAQPASRPMGSVFVSMTQIFTSSNESERAAGEIESSVNPVHSMRPVTWGPHYIAEAGASSLSSSPPPPPPRPPPPHAGLPAPPPPPRPPPPVQTRL